MATGEELSEIEAYTRMANGIGTGAGLAAGVGSITSNGINIARTNITSFRPKMYTMPGSKAVSRLGSPIRAAAGQMGQSIQKIIPPQIQSAFAKLSEVLNYDLLEPIWKKIREYKAPTSVRPSVDSSLPGRVTQELPAGGMRTPAEVKQARNFFDCNRDAAKKWYEQRTGKAWPDDATHFEHPRPLKDGGDPLFVEPGFNGPNAPHMIPGPDGLTDFQRWGRLGDRPPNQ